jgi:hypothetical protein
MVKKYIFFIIFILLFLNTSLCIPIRSQDQSVNFFTKYRDKYVKNTVKTDFGTPGDGSLIDPVRFKSEATEPEQIAFEYLEQYLLAKEDICLDKRDIKITAIQESPGGTTVRFHQLKDGIPVYLTESSITINKKGIISWTNIFIRPEVMKQKGSSGLRKTGTIDIIAIRESVEAYFGFAEDELKIDSAKLTWFERATKGAVLAWETSVSTPTGTWGVCIDAENGEVLQAGPSDYRADGWGYVFKPDPLTSAQVPYGGDYAYNGDKNNAALHAERKLVSLRDITYEGGQYKLEGPYCVLIDVEAPDICIGEHDTYPITRSDDLFDYTREEPEFEGVMCYYYIDQSARYLKSLGYWDKDGDSNTGLDRLQIDPHGSRCHSEFKMNLNIILMQEDYPSYDEVDAAEDAGVILHEYGHAIQHNIGPGLTSAAYGEPESSAIWEGSADYWDITHRASFSSYEWSKHAHWRQKGHTLPDGRTADVGFAYPYENNHHVGGQIWSSALMNIWWKIGKKTTDILFLETIKRLEQIPSFAKAAMTFINNDYDLYQGRHRKEILESFDQYGLIDYINQIPYKVEPIITFTGLTLRKSGSDTTTLTCRTTTEPIMNIFCI